MALPTLKRRELTNAALCFIPAGETVDSVVVSAELWPDDDPASNFTDYEIPDIEKVVLEKNEIEEEIMIPDDEGGYHADDENMVVGRTWVATTAKTNNFIKQLDKGLAAPVVADAAQDYGTKSDNFLLGLLRITERNKDGAVIEVTHVWAKMRVRTSGETGPATKKIEITFKKQPSSLNSVVVS